MLKVFLTCAFLFVTTATLLQPSRQFRQLAAQFEASKKEGLKDAQSPLPDRKSMSDNFEAMVPIPVGSSITPISDCPVPSLWVRGPGVTSDVKSGVVLYFHGGGYSLGDARMYNGMTSTVSRDINLPLLFVEYPLAPETLFPGSVASCLSVYQWLIEVQGVDPKRVVLAGDSAGGGMVLLVLQALGRKGLRFPGGAVAISAWSDLSGSGESFSTMEEFDVMLTGLQLRSYYITGGLVSLQSPYVSPLFGNFTGFPRLMVIVGQNEILLSDSLRVAARARAAGVDVHLEVGPHMCHVYPILGDMFPEAAEGRAQMSAFIHDILDSPRSGKDEL